MSKQAKKRISKVSLETLKMERGPKCERCGRDSMLTVDHIVPIVLLENMGLMIEECYERELIAILCQPCNQLKSHKLDFADPRTKKILLKLLERL